MALSDFWEVKDFQTFLGKTILNVYHVKRILAGANAFSVAQGFIDSIIMAELADLQDTDLGRTVLEVTNLGDVTDFITSDTSALAGLRVGVSFSGFTAATVQFNRTRTDMKNGQKRFCVGNETDANQGVWNAGIVTELNDLATALITPWEDNAAPGIDICQLVVLKRFCVVPAQDPCLQYRLPNTTAEVDANHYVPVSTIVRGNQRSQVSRKIL